MGLLPCPDGRTDAIGRAAAAQKQGPYYLGVPPSSNAPASASVRPSASANNYNKQPYPDESEMRSSAVVHAPPACFRTSHFLFYCDTQAMKRKCSVGFFRLACQSSTQCCR